MSYGQGDFDPTPEAVRACVDQIAKSCGWRDRTEMRLTVAVWRRHFEQLQQIASGGFK